MQAEIEVLCFTRKTTDKKVRIDSKPQGQAAHPVAAFDQDVR
jgi:hypothetical protein